MPSKITNYQCPGCTGPLKFSAATGRLECEYCGGSYAVSEMEARYAARNEKAREADRQQEKNASRWGADAARMRAYNCPSCGAELICEETTAATACPYCGNQSVVPGQFRDERKPDHVLPFRVEKEAAVQALKQHYRGKPLLPRGFASENHLQEIKGVYVPFWLYDVRADANVTFAATRTHVHQTRDERVITTKHYAVDRAGSVRFEKVPVDGASKMPNELMDAIEPFDYGEMKPFALGYLPGFLAERYDEGGADCALRAEERCRNSAIDAMRDSVVGYDTCRVDRADVKLSRSEPEYALLPVWLLSTRWKEKTYLFAMNGQSGRFIGDLPISWGKAAVWFAAVFAALFAIGMLFFAPEEVIPGALLLAAAVVAVLCGLMKSAGKKSEADGYIPAMGANVFLRNDRYLRTTVSRQRIQHSEPRGGGPGGHGGPGGPGGHGGHGGPGGRR